MTDKFDAHSKYKSNVQIFENCLPFECIKEMCLFLSLKSLATVLSVVIALQYIEC